MEDRSGNPIVGLAFVMKKLIILIPFLVVVLGCLNEQPTATAAEEKAFRNPPKEPPTAAMEGMRKGMEEAKKRGGGG
jgi:hypothetical protein